MENSLESEKDFQNKQENEKSTKQDGNFSIVQRFEPQHEHQALQFPNQNDQ